MKNESKKGGSKKADEGKENKEVLVEEKVEKNSISKVVVETGFQKREFSLTIHGENFMELAEKFAKKFNGKILN